MGNEELYYFGKILKTHGNKGYFLVSCEHSEFHTIDPPEVMFVEIDGDRVPFFPDYFEFLTNTTLLLKFDDISSPEEGEDFLARSLFIQSSVIPKKKGKSFYKEELTGYLVIDSRHGEIGNIEAVLNFPSQSMIRIRKDDNEILIPVADEFIRKVDRKKKLVLVSLPEGLVNLNY